MSKGFCKVNAQGKGKGNLAQVREINIHLYMLCIFKSPKQSLETCCVCSFYNSSSFLTLNLSIAFISDGLMELYKTLGYDRPPY